MRLLYGFGCFLLLAFGSAAQTCPTQQPKAAGESSVLQGKLVFHDELRTWLGLKLEQPTCGQKEIQLIFSTVGAWKNAESLRGCTVTATGELYESPTGYYSTDMAISDAMLNPSPTCHPFPVKPDPAAVVIDPKLKEFHASITVDLRGKGHIDTRVWKDTDRLSALTPWQPYVSFNLTGGGDVIWIGCRNSFAIAEITQTPKSSSPMMPGDTSLAGFNLNEKVNVISFACRKKAASGSLKTPVDSLRPLR